MKKLLAVIFAAVISASALAGCGDAANKAASTGKEVVTDAVSGAGEVADEIGQDITTAASAVVSNADNMFENGEVSDNDGIIGNEGEENNLQTYEETRDEIIEETMAE